MHDRSRLPLGSQPLGGKSGMFGKVSMMSDIFYCPVCKGPLLPTPVSFQCSPCRRNFQIVNGIPDFFVADSEHDFSDDPNIIWLDSKIVEARDTVYRLCTRQLKGMTFCMHEMGRRTSKGCRVLEVGMGTGHFTRWLTEVSEPGTAVYAFDFSRPIIEKARVNIGESPEVTLFRANAREGLPFQAGAFDIVFARLAPLGPRGVPNVQAAFELLKPGGWYFGAGWEMERYETPPIEWTIQHGYESAEYHEWQYRRVQSEEEYIAWQTEQKHLLAMREGGKAKGTSERTGFDSELNQGGGRGILKMTREHVLIAQRPL
jgi:SAM-dependent methyltransferase